MAANLTESLENKENTGKRRELWHLTNNAKLM